MIHLPSFTRQKSGMTKRDSSRQYNGDSILADNTVSPPSKNQILRKMMACMAPYRIHPGLRSDNNITLGDQIANVLADLGFSPFTFNITSWLNGKIHKITPPQTFVWPGLQILWKTKYAYLLLVVDIWGAFFLPNSKNFCYGFGWQVPSRMSREFSAEFKKKGIFL